MKTMIKFFKKQREIRLRKWCVEQAIGSLKGGLGYGYKEIANELYDWITSAPPK